MGRKGAEDLPPDTSARIVLYDAMMSASGPDQVFDGLTEEELFERVIPRLRVLVPRELHNQGERAYVASKVAVCLEANILQPHPRRPGLLVAGSRRPSVRYPDGTVRDYSAGLEPARERLDADEAKLRRAGFDIRRIVPSPAEDKKSDRFRNLVESMREHGFLDYFPIIESASGVTLDGVARVAAAAEADIELKDRHRVRLKRRDTPLQQTLLVLHLNADRLAEIDVAKVQDVIADRTNRTWLEIQRDLELTRDWRRAEPKDYDAKLDVQLVAWSDGDEPRVQVTTDGTRVMLRSLMREAGLPEYRRDDLLSYVPSEEARTQHSGRAAFFVPIREAIDGIERMQRERERRRLRVYPGWDDVRKWLLALDDPDPTSRSEGTIPTLDGG